MNELNGVSISESYINSIILRLCEFANGSEFYKTDELENVVRSYIKAMKYFFNNCCGEALYLANIRMIAKTFFEGLGLNYNLRSTDVIIGNNDFRPADKNRIPYLIQELLQAYNINSGDGIPFSFAPVVKDLDVYDNEALFHIGFVRIQPFDDGNKRLANLLTVLNFLKYYGLKDILPPILTIEQREEYFAAIRDNDYKRLGRIYRESCQREKTEFEQFSSENELGQGLPRA
jgi:Fic family protein